jgi:hypothetical protein
MSDQRPLATTFVREVRELLVCQAPVADHRIVARDHIHGKSGPFQERGHLGCNRGLLIHQQEMGVVPSLIASSGGVVTSAEHLAYGQRGATFALLPSWAKAA